VMRGRMLLIYVLLCLFVCHSMVTGLIVEAKGTQNAIEEAHAAVESALEMSNAPAPAHVNSFDGDLFGFDEPAPAPAPAAPLRAPAQSYSSAYSEEEDEQQQPMGVTSMLSGNSEDYGHRPSEDYGMAPLPGPPPGGPYEISPPASSPSHLRSPSSASAGAFDNEAIMGGGPAPLPTEAAEPPSYGAAETSERSYYGHDKGGPTPTNESIAELKRKAKEAEDLASDAEESRRQVMAQVNELRRVSDEAEALSRQHATSPTAKARKGFMGRGKKNKKDEVCLMSSVILSNVLATE
jgi:hypothetical protein